MAKKWRVYQLRGAARQLGVTLGLVRQKSESAAGTPRVMRPVALLAKEDGVNGLQRVVDRSHVMTVLIATSLREGRVVIPVHVNRVRFVLPTHTLFVEP